VVGATSFAQLLLNPHHDNIAVAGGKQAIADQAEVVEEYIVMLQGCEAKFLSGKGISKLAYVRDLIEILRAALSNSAKTPPDAAPAQSGGAAVVADVGTAALRAAGQREGEVAGLVGAAAAVSGRNKAAKGAGAPVSLLVADVAQTKHRARAGLAGGEQLITIPVAQLLLELAALLCSHEEMWVAGYGALLCVLDVAGRLAPEELLSFCEDAGALLLQMLWLHEQHNDPKKHQLEGLQRTLFDVVVPLVSGGLCLRLLSVNPRVMKSTMITMPFSVDFETDQYSCV
jgi:hypothetical protein